MAILILIICIACPCMIFLDYQKQQNPRIAVIYMALFFLVMALMFPFLMKNFGWWLLLTLPLLLVILLILKRFSK